MLSRKSEVVLFCCVLLILILTACPSSPPPSGGSPPPAVEPEPAAVSSDQPQDAGQDAPPTKAGNLAEALAFSSKAIAESLPSGATVAIISITASDPFEGEYALEELTILLVNTKKFRVVDRGNLDVIRAEQRFQLSGEVDDETAVSIGHLLGAAFVVSGGISLYDQVKYLRLRVLDVQTGQIQAMTSVSYGGDL
jgi:PBP1b-binding outer membrane lipoprotein LpoB